MTIEERFEFLFQSIESRNQQLGELADGQARLMEGQEKTDQQISELRAGMKEGFERMDRGFERVQLNLDRLALAMTGLTEHVADHARRIEKIERRSADGESN